MCAAETITALLAHGADEAVAIAAPARAPLIYRGLRSQLGDAVQTLNRLGIGRNDPVAVVLRNGPEMASVFLSIAAGATAAPLNPDYTADEFRFFLGDLEARLLVVDADSESPAIGVAEAAGIPVARLVVESGAPAGRFSLLSADRRGDTAAVAMGPAEPGDVALLLHTSGTTARPKIVPLTQRNLCVSAANIADSLALTPADRCLNIMPLFHIHGLIAAVLSSLHAGASILCSPGFNALKFFSLVKAFEPTWYTAVPTMHQAILARAARNADIIEAAHLRLIRSSSAALPPQIMQALETAFSAPVIEAYGMTEAAHQMASNPLPPAKRKPGSVGIAAGPQVAIMGENGALLPTSQPGEIVIRGANVTPGYRNNPQANAAAFTNGWFRTGDQGYLDEDEYLHLTGRLKEIINRGGEKISPREIDEVLLAHPAVAQVVTFAVPHEKLGEDVAAAVVLEEGAHDAAEDIRRFAAERLADHKVPRQIIIVEEIPKGPTGKLQRIGLAEKLGLG